MKTGLTKRQKDTVICFNEESDIIEVRTHNTDLRNRLLKFSEQYPDCCKLTDDDEQGGMLFEIQKGRLSAKNIVGNRKKLTWWQDEFWKHRVKKYPDMERGKVRATRAENIFRRGSLRYSEAVEMADVMRYDIVWVKRSK